MQKWPADCTLSHVFCSFLNNSNRTWNIDLGWNFFFLWRRPQSDTRDIQTSTAIEIIHFSGHYTKTHLTAECCNWPFRLKFAKEQCNKYEIIPDIIKNKNHFSQLIPNCASLICVQRVKTSIVIMGLNILKIFWF